VAEYEGNPVADALMAAITDEPLSEEARDDAEFLAEHRAAVADLALLREQLAIIGDAVADGAEVTESVPARRNRKARKSKEARKPRNRRPAGAPKKRSRHPGALSVTLGTLVAAVVATMVVGMGWLIAQNGVGASSDSAKSSKADSGDSRGGDASLSAPGYVACSRLIVEGTVAEVEPFPGVAQDRITFDVDRYYKPDKGKDQITFVMDEDVYPRLHKGDHVLIGIPGHAASPDIWTTGEKAIAREREWILKALPQSRGLTCE
jgi:hypothetical protein